MIKILRYIFFIFFFSSCSFHDSGGFWTQEKELEKSVGQFKKVFKKKEINIKEFNSNFKLSLNKSSIKINQNSNINNNDGYTLFDNEFKTKTKYNFSKIKNFEKLDSNLIVLDKNIIFFDNKGNILNFNQNSKLIWKINNYSKEEKKIGPLITMAHDKDKLIIADNLAKTYAIDLKTGKILWTKKNLASFNSQIKIIRNKFFIIDINNNLYSFLTNSGDMLWKHSTEKTFINSSEKLSLIVKDNLIVFSNSFGDITAVDFDKGTLVWQISTLKSEMYEEIMKLRTSNIIENENSIYFSNNEGKFYSLDLETGAINWTQNLSSKLKSTVINNLIFSISDDGYLYVIEKMTGNILRITNIFKGSKLTKKEKISPTGFILNSKKIFVSTNVGSLIVIDLKTGKLVNVIKVDRGKISRPLTDNKYMYLIRDDSIIKLN